ncbi:hypothetical protein L1887_57614 [Cichorium endivia]|nr:hypothetical protein L1887_57614 [Cichorium endivia]
MSSSLDGDLIKKYSQQSDFLNRQLKFENELRKLSSENARKDAIFKYLKLVTSNEPITYKDFPKVRGDRRALGEVRQRKDSGERAGCRSTTQHYAQGDLRSADDHLDADVRNLLAVCAHTRSEQPADLFAGRREQRDRLAALLLRIGTAVLLSEPADRELRFHTEKRGEKSAHTPLSHQTGHFARCIATGDRRYGPQSNCGGEPAQRAGQFDWRSEFGQCGRLLSECAVQRPAIVLLDCQRSPDRRGHLEPLSEDVKEIELESQECISVAGVGEAGDRSNCAVNSALFNEPNDVVYSEKENVLYVVDTNNHKIKLLNLDKSQVNTMRINFIKRMTTETNNKIVKELPLLKVSKPDKTSWFEVSQNEVSFSDFNQQPSIKVAFTEQAPHFTKFTLEGIINVYYCSTMEEFCSFKEVTFKIPVIIDPHDIRNDCFNVDLTFELRIWGIKTMLPVGWKKVGALENWRQQRSQHVNSAGY